MQNKVGDIGTIGFQIIGSGIVNFEVKIALINVDAIWVQFIGEAPTFAFTHKELYLYADKDQVGLLDQKAMYMYVHVADFERDFIPRKNDAKVNGTPQIYCGGGNCVHCHEFNAYAPSQEYLCYSCRQTEGWRYVV